MDRDKEVSVELAERIARLEVRGDEHERRLNKHGEDIGRIDRFMRYFVIAVAIAALLIGGLEIGNQMRPKAKGYSHPAPSPALSIQPRP